MSRPYRRCAPLPPKGEAGVKQNETGLRVSLRAGSLDFFRV